MSHQLRAQRNTQPQTPPKQTKRQSNRVLLGVLSVAAGAIIVMNVVMLLQRSQPNPPLPTLIALAQSTDTPLVTLTAGIMPAVTQTIAAVVPTSTLVKDPVSNVVPTVSIPTSTDGPAEETTSPVSALPQASQQNSIAAASNRTSLIVVSTEVPTVNATDQMTEAQPTLSDATPISPTATVTQVIVPPTVQPTIEATPLVSGIVETGVPLGHGVETAIGEIRVITSTRNAEATIRSLGGVMPAAPANQAWLLVEVLLICHEQSTCAVSPSSFSVVGASGTQYAASSQLMITPLLGSSITNGQAWGYLGFTIPTHETALRLVMHQGNQNSVLALQ